LNPIQRKPERSDFGLPEGTGIPKDNQNALLSIPDHWLAEGTKDEVRREKRYKTALDDWKAYQDWAQKRNPKRKELEAKNGYDCKHAAHLIRLIRMAKEILQDGEVHVYRPDRDELRQILNGEWSYDKVIAEADKMDEELEALYATSKLRNKPDHKGIKDLYFEICEEWYGIKIRT
jgi:hypothetical protein